MKEQHSADNNTLTKSLDVLIAMMEKVKLKKENYITLMKGLKVFIDDKHTQKHGYKLLAKIIEKYELTDINELLTIQRELNPLIHGHATKERMRLIKAYTIQLSKFKDNVQNLSQIGDFIKLVVIELITAFTNANFKTRELAMECFSNISDLLKGFQAIPQLFQILLVGFAGT